MAAKHDAGALDSTNQDLFDEAVVGHVACDRDGTSRRAS